MDMYYFQNCQIVYKINARFYLIPSNLFEIHNWKTSVRNTNVWNYNKVLKHKIEWKCYEEFDSKYKTLSKNNLSIWPVNLRVYRLMRSL